MIPSPEKPEHEEARRLPLYVCENCGRLGHLPDDFSDDCTPGWTHGRLTKVDPDSPGIRALLSKAEQERDDLRKDRADGWEMANAAIAEVDNLERELERLREAGATMRKRGHSNSCAWVLGGPRAKIEWCQCGAHAWDLALSADTQREGRGDA